LSASSPFFCAENDEQLYSFRVFSGPRGAWGSTRKWRLLSLYSGKFRIFDYRYFGSL
jgi:hypothetical protein